MKCFFSRGIHNENQSFTALTVASRCIRTAAIHHFHRSLCSVVSSIDCPSARQGLISRSRDARDQSSLSDISASHDQYRWIPHIHIGQSLLLVPWVNGPGSAETLDKENRCSRRFQFRQPFIMHAWIKSPKSPTIKALIACIVV